MSGNTHPNQWRHITEDLNINKKSFFI